MATPSPNQSAIESYAFKAADRLVAANLIHKEERSRAASILAREYDEMFPAAEPLHEVADSFGG